MTLPRTQIAHEAWLGVQPRAQQTPEVGLPDPLCHLRPARFVTCQVEELQPHPSYLRVHVTVSASQLSALALQGEFAFQQPVTITRDRYVVDGYAQLVLARQQGRLTIPCLEYDLNQEESLRLLLYRHRGVKGLTDFCRISLALELETSFRQTALINLRRGGRIKGSSNLTDAEKVDVRREIASTAGVSVGNVSKVKKLLQDGSPEVLQSLRQGEISIHRAFTCLGKPEKELNQLHLEQNKRGIKRDIESLLRAHRPHQPRDSQFDLLRISSALAGIDNERRAAVIVDKIQVPGKVILLSTELLEDLESQGKV